MDRKRTNGLVLLVCGVALAGLFAAPRVSAATLNVPDDYGTIQAAIDAAGDGDTVQVAPGTYQENLRWLDKSIALVGAGADVTVVDGGGSGICLRMERVPETAVVEGFTFTAGHYYPWFWGAGVSMMDSSVTLRNSSVTENLGLIGGGVGILRGSPTLIDNVISGNTARFDSGVYAEEASVTLTGNVVSENSAQNGTGGIECWNCPTVKLLNNTISANTSTAPSAAFGGVFISASQPGCSVEMWNNTVADNSSVWTAGAYIEGCSSVIVADNTFSRNGTTQQGAGGLRIQVASTIDPAAFVTVDSNLIADNRAFNAAAGLELYGAGGSSMVAVNNTIVRNVSVLTTPLTGGGVRLSGGQGSLTFANNTVVANGGGGVIAMGTNGFPPLSLTNNIVASNLGPGVDSRGPVALTNDTVVGNEGGGVYVRSSGCMLTNCIVWGNTGQPDIAGGSAATYSVTYSCVGTGVADGEGNISLDPLFVDLAGEDYHLRPSSPCIDAGSNDAPDLPDVDLDGYPRVVGSAVDMGAYEVQTPQTQLASLDELIAACVGEQSIAPELQSSLVAKINAAIAALNRGKPNDAKVAMNELKALVNQVQAQSGNKIDAAAAAEIILGADLVIEQLGG